MATIKLKKFETKTEVGINPIGTLDINENGIYNVRLYENVNVNVELPEDYIKPMGVLNISKEGLYDVSVYAQVIVGFEKEQLNITPTQEVQTFTPSQDTYFDEVVVNPIPSEYVVPNGTSEIDENGTYNVKEFEFVDVNVPIPDEYIVPSGTKTISENGEHNVREFESVNVEVPIPSDYIKPQGTFEANVEGTYDVREYENAKFSVQKQQLEITPTEETQEFNPIKNGFFDNVVVFGIPSDYIVPSGTIDITNTNEIDVKQYAKAQVKDENLKPENIAENVEVLGVKGTFKGGLDTSDANATPNDILLGKTAYVNDQKIEGTIETYDGASDVGAERSLKKLLDNTMTTNGLFRNYQGTSIDNLINYSDTEKVNNMNNTFSGCSNLTTIPLLNTSNATQMYGMFYGCKNLTNIPLLDTSKVRDMGNMFYECNNLLNIPLLDTSNVTDMTRMFYKCNNLTSIPLLDTSKVRNMYEMFYNCYELKDTIKLNTDSATDLTQVFLSCSYLHTIDITSMDNVSTCQGMCSGCSVLKKFIIRTMTKIPTLSSFAFDYCYFFTGEKQSYYNPEGLKDGRIYVPDEWVEQLKVATNWSEFADIIVPLSTLEEE